MRVSKQQMRLGVIVAGVLGLYFALAWWPIVRDMKNLRQDIVTAEESLGIARGRTDGLIKLAERVDELRARAAANNKVIPESSEMAAVLRRLSLEIEAAELTGQGMSTLDTEHRRDVIERPVELTLSGHSPAVFGFVERIEAMPQLIHVESVLIQRAKEEPRKVDAAVRIRTFFGSEQEIRS
jgi:Tfp pilus assembly protein PilO